MRRKLIGSLVVAAVLAFGAAGAWAVPDGALVKETGAVLIVGDALAPAGLPDGAVSYATDLLGGG